MKEEKPTLTHSQLESLAKLINVMKDTEDIIRRTIDVNDISEEGVYQLTKDGFDIYLGFSKQHITVGVYDKETDSTLVSNLSATFEYSCKVDKTCDIVCSVNRSGDILEAKYLFCN